ncbi:MAG: alkaline phosphatase family protein [Candidatus Woesearchaeota archaeon]|nr:MAG: alkaline phosphatase family protein [Candidatus Woesearchaeota archaeon]
MIVIFAIDALEYNLVEEFNCKNLKQKYYGKTDISEFSQPRTMVLWSSFMTGKNKEDDVLEDGNKEMWNKKWDIKETFFSFFENPVVLDLPGFSYDLGFHGKSRILLKNFFETKNLEKKENLKKEYNKDAFDHHRKIKDKFFKALGEDRDFVLGYFSVADVIGHLNFGNKVIMKMIYIELDEMAEKIKKNKRVKSLIILSDHGMKAIGRFGDHSEYGFWSTNFKDLKTPKITEFYELIRGIKNES